VAKLVLFNKPFNVLSQFSDQANRQTLGDYLDLPGFRPAGRLDRDSEGLLLLTDDGKLQQQIAHPKYGKNKHYWVQVEGEITDQALSQLAEGVILNDGLTRPARAGRILPPANLWERHPPIRHRKFIPTSWIELVIKEGRNRQIRRMTAAVGFPTLRLIRHQVGKWKLGKLKPGEYRQESFT
jgi:23S rRNA pseudouridine2457 synthase